MGLFGGRSGFGGGGGRRGAGGGRGGPATLGRRITPVVVWIAGLEVGFFLMFLFGAPRRLEAHLAMIPALFLGNHEYWMPLTAMLVSLGGLQLVFDLVALWLFVPALEEYWGTRRFAAFFFGLGAFGFLVYGLIGWRLSPQEPAGGLSSAILATVIAFGALFPRAPVSFFGLLPLTSKQLAWGIAAFALGTELLQQAWAYAIADSATMLLAFVLTAPALRNRLSLTRYRERRLRRKYKVLPGGRHDHWMN